MTQISRDTVMARVTGVFHDIFDDDSLIITDDTSAADIEEWDSLMHITLVVAMEKEFGLRLKVSEIGKLRNVGIMVDLFLDRLA